MDRATKRLSGWAGFATTVVLAILATAICLPFRAHLSPANVIMVYLLTVAVIAAKFGIRESALACVLSVSAFDFFFVPPYLTFAVSDPQYLLTFAVMLVVAMIISGLGLQLRRQALDSEARESRTAILYRLSRDLAKTRSRREIAVIGAREISTVFRCETAILFATEGGGLEVVARSRSRFEDIAAERTAANRAQETSGPTGAGTGAGSDAEGRYFPLIAIRGVIGVLGIRTSDPLGPAQQSLLETLSNGLALAIERTLLAKESHVARLSAESERLRNVLLNSVSHDLRTPLTAIAGSASALAEGKGNTKELAATIVEQADRMNRQVQNLLDMTRLESSTVNPNLEWHSIEELIGTALAQTDKLLEGRVVRTYIPASLPLVRVDGMLLEKALVNLLENVASHTPPGTPIEIRVSKPAGRLRISIEDHGSGIPAGQEERIFDKFYRPDEKAGDRGFGLGLAICRSIAEAHGGRAYAENRGGGGSRFVIELSASGQAPEVPFD